MKALVLITACALFGCTSIHQQQRQVTAYPKFDQRSVGGLRGPDGMIEPAKSLWLIIDDGKTDIEILWSNTFEGKPNLFFPVSLQTNTPYVFQLQEKVYSKLSPSMSKEMRQHGVDPARYMRTNYTIVSIKQGNDLLYNQTICEVHNCKMNYVNAPIIYGLRQVRFPHPTLEEYKKLFPHYEEQISGGCLSVEDNKSERILVCQQCKDAHTKWEREHPETNSLRRLHR